ncbi:MAG TPA: DUF4149 domain-containing protein [Tepidisphaeraceae bacterium]|nr:DUF4149 domain-containing protein [Tepidisphaeraceae bacterium]
MSRADWFQLVQIVYWLALATWFGGVLFVAIAAPVIFRTVRDANPVLPHVLSVNLEGQHGTLLAGSVVGNLLVRIGPMQVICAGALLLATGAHFFLANINGPNRTAAVIRMSLIIAAGGLAAFDAWVVWPQIWRHREQFIEHADEPDVANPALDQFDRGQRRSLVLIMSVLFLLLGLILFSGNITPRAGQPTQVQPNPQAGG